MTRLLLDTHIVLWSASDPERVPPRALALLKTPGAELYISAASAWEISIKYAAGKLELPMHPRLFIQEAIARLDLIELAMTVSDSIRAGGLPTHHQDPFDRMLVAQSQGNRLPLVSVDKRMALYDVEVIAG